MRFLLVLPARKYRDQLKGRESPAERIFDYSVLPCLYVASSTPADVDVRIVNEDHEPIDFEAPVDLVGISIMAMNAPRGYEIAGRFRERGVPVIAGGFHATLHPEEALRHCDAVCVGDGERIMPRVIEDARAGRLAGVYHDPVEDLSELPLPDRRRFRRRSVAHFDIIQATRGCPRECDFCSITAFHHHTYRRRPADAVAREMATLGGTVFFMDDNLTATRRYALDLFEAIRPLRRRWFGQCSVSMAFDDEVLDGAARSGCRGMFVGFESLSESNLAAAGKDFNEPSRYEEAVRRFHEKGMLVFAGIVFGMDGDTSEVFERTLRFVEQARIDLLAANILTPFPGTPLHDRLDREGRITSRDLDLYDMNQVVFEPRGMSAETLKSGTSWVRARFYSRSRILRRLARGATYLDPGTLFGAALPINAAFHARLRRGPTRQHAARFKLTV